MRPIDADALLTVPNVRKITEYDETGEGITYLAVPVEAIEKAPTIEAEPVRHAKVLYNVAIEKEECCGYKKRKGLVLQKYTCSSCYTAIPGESKFCMECGAKLNWGNEDGA